MAHLPESIGPYRVLTAIASGGMAEVFEVEDPTSGERLALKLLQNLKVALKRFNREYEAMARLNHPGVVRVYHYGLHQGRPWLTMELLQGSNAHDWTREFGSPGSQEREDEVIRIGYHLATALHYVHDRGLVHRDLKSANVIVLPDARVKLVDFGTAHLLDGAEQITREGEFVGTFAYASPEQVQGRPLNHKSDLYSLGILLYRLTTGRRPFGAKEPGELAWQHIHEPPADPRAHVPQTAAPLAELILELLAKNPENRPATAGRVAATLEQLAGRPFSSRSPVALHRKTATSRHLERARIWRRLDRGDAGQHVTVSGEVGSGLGRLATALLHEADDRGWQAVEIALRRDRDVAALVRGLLSLAAGLAHREDVAAACEALRSHSRLERRGRPESRAAVVQAASALCEARVRAAGRPLLLLLSQPADAGPVALELLGGVARELRARAVPSALVWTVRPGDVGPETPLGQLLAGCWTATLPALTPADVATAAATMLGRRPPPGALARRLHEVCGGQPIYLEQLVADLVRTREILADDNRVDWADQQIRISAPPQAADDARRVLAALPAFHRRLLDALSVASEAELEVVARMLDWPVDAVRAGLQPLIARHVLAWRDASHRAVDWTNRAIHREVTAALRPTRRAAWVRALAAELDRETAPSAIRVRALTWAGRALEAAPQAGPVARALLAENRVRTALDLLEPVIRELSGKRVPNDVAFVEPFLQHSLALQAIHPAHTETARSLGVARRIPDQPKQLQARVTWADATHARSIGHYPNYARYVDQALHTLGTDPEGAEVHAWLRIEQGHARRLEGVVQRAESSYRTAENLGRKLEDLRILAHATIGVAGCLLDQGSLTEAEREASRAMAQLERIGDAHGFWAALTVWGQAMRRQGRYSDALGLLYQRVHEARHHEDPRAYSPLLLALTWCELDLERLGRAQENVDELESSIGRAELLHVRLETSLLRGRILLSSGQARAAAYELQTTEQRARLAELRVIAEQARAWHAEALWTLGDRDAARGMFQSALLGLMGLGVRTAVADATVSRARALGREVDPITLYVPVQAWLDETAPPLLRLEELLTRGAWLRRKGDREAARVAHREAAMVLNRVATDLNDTDRAALRVHSWSRRIRRGLR